MTFGQWPWKSESVKECVKTHQTNAIALKINGAESVQTYKQPIIKNKNKFINYCVSFCDANNLIKKI